MCQVFSAERRKYCCQEVAELLVQIFFPHRGDFVVFCPIGIYGHPVVNLQLRIGQLRIADGGDYVVCIGQSFHIGGRVAALAGNIFGIAVGKGSGLGLGFNRDSFGGFRNFGSLCCNGSRLGGGSCRNREGELAACQHQRCAERSSRQGAPQKGGFFYHIYVNFL